MESKELRTIADGMMDDEAAVMAKILTLREPQPRRKTDRPHNKLTITGTRGHAACSFVLGFTLA